MKAVLGGKKLVVFFFFQSNEHIKTKVWERTQRPGPAASVSMSGMLTHED